MLRRSWSSAVIAIFSSVFLVGSSQTAGAEPFTFVTANLGCVSNGTGINACPEHNGDEDGTFGIDGHGGFIQVTDETDKDEFGNPFNDANFDYLAKADAEFGILHAAASGTFSGLTPGEETSIRTAGAFAGVTDLLTITAPGQTGTGTLAVSLLLDGVFQRSAGAGAFAFVGVTAGQNPDLFGQGNEAVPFDSILVVPSGPLVATVTFTWGQPFYLGLVMGVGAGTPVSCALCEGSGDANPTPALVASGSASADFFSTLKLIGLLPTDDDTPGSPVLNAQYSAKSGAVYSVDGIVSQPVPEPTSLLLLGTGLVFTVRRRRRG
jgi:hypothetical protein